MAAPCASRFGHVRIAVLVRCYNEAVTIGTVVRGFLAALLGARVYVFDNRSSDDTAGAARRAGAVVRQVADQGKGNVIRRMFADVEADVYVLVDGDDTYDASAAPALVETLLANGLDMVVGARRSDEREAYRLGHRFGNRLLTRFVAVVPRSPSSMAVTTGASTLSRARTRFSTVSA
ncbi:N-glycosyltransferase [Caballeronia glebae]|uniref:N-glycosyltransferase n=1 Tax=Caballeronia glebae TaxID=1777143 RepID=A0A158DBG3_9BURK|nr:N-glycosyltransferase [Caballeronia glebae]